MPEKKFHTPLKIKKCSRPPREALATLWGLGVYRVHENYCYFYAVIVHRHKNSVSAFVYFTFSAFLQFYMQKSQLYVLCFKGPTITFTSTMDQMTLQYVKVSACYDDTTENYHPSAVLLSLVAPFSSLFWFYSLQIPPNPAAAAVFRLNAQHLAAKEILLRFIIIPSTIHNKKVCFMNCCAWKDLICLGNLIKINKSWLTG